MKPSKSINSLAGGYSLHNNGNSNNNGSSPSHASQNNNIVTNGKSSIGSRLHHQLQQPPVPNATLTSANPANSNPTSPICRCRVMYLGSAVPYITKDGLQGIQEPLKELYPDKSSLVSGNAGIDSWLSIWSNGILIENIDETGREVKRFFKIDALHYCAAVKYAPTQNDDNGNPQQPPIVSQQQQHYGTLASQSSQQMITPKFLPLDWPHVRQTADTHPPIFACILRRTTGIKVLECHAFICKREAAANALVRCCFHAYADTMYAKQIGADVDLISSEINNNLNINDNDNSHLHNKSNRHQQQQLQQQDYEHDHDHETQSAIIMISGSSNNNNNRLSQQQVDQQQQQYEVPGESMGPMATRRSKFDAAPNSVDTNSLSNNNQQQGSSRTPSESSDYNEVDRGFNGQQSHQSLVMRRKSLNERNMQYGDIGGPNDGNPQFRNHQQQALTYNSNLLKQHNKCMSKSMHHLNQNFDPYFGAYGTQDFPVDKSAWPPMSNLNLSHHHQHQPERSPFHQQQQPFYSNPIASRVPSYPPPNLMESANGGGTLKSIKSMAVNSIASTLLRSKKHAKAMSMAQLNHHQPQAENNNINKVMSFHQPSNANGSTIGQHSMINGGNMFPPVPNMFLHHHNQMQQNHRPVVNGSQTMKLPSRSAPVPYVGPPINFEAMTPKEMKKLLKKSAKYGLDPSKFNENGLPILPLRGMPPMPPMIPMPPQMQQMPPMSQLPPHMQHMHSHLPTPQPPASKTGTMVSQSIYSMDIHDGSDLASIQSFTMRPPSHASHNQLPPPPPPLRPMHHLPMDPMHPMNFDPGMKPMLVKPNQEFLKSKAGKKWLKQQKEFKKLLPPHLDGLPIVFGPPPIEALEPASPMGSFNGAYSDHWRGNE